ncbi:PAS domain-containing protein (plasmid) [Agrobacterium rosae]|uniref:PAS domain-containing protein n=1 Tax=Agrobacterium rosae TaxID=1972867 RepID=A0ABU4W4N0_9HYPH|nr:PAS domain-containing protein [Agrobacterium rosae]MDX8331813.1 PAS domain-containing protein [Agrobacterium rosae]
MKHDGNIANSKGKFVSKLQDDVRLKKNVGIFTWDVQNNRLSGNEFLAEVFGLDAHAVAIGLPVEAYFAAVVDIDRPQVAKSLQETLISNAPCYQEYRVRRTNGSETPITSIGHCFRDVHGEPTSYAGVVFESEVATTTAKKFDMHSHCLAAYSLAAEIGDHTAMRILLEFFWNENDVGTELMNMNVLH